jgi:recombinational DNA repair protein RecR
MNTVYPSCGACEICGEVDPCNICSGNVKEAKPLPTEKEKVKSKTPVGSEGF